MHALWLILSEDGQHRPAPGRLHGRHRPGGREEGAGPRPGADLPRAGQPRRRRRARGVRALNRLQKFLREETRLGIPAHVARGVPGRPHGARRDDVPVGARVRRDLEPGPRSNARRRPSGARPAASAATRAWRRCSTSRATSAGAAPRRRSARTRTSWACWAHASCAACRARSAICSRRSSTSPATRGARARATTGRSTSAGAS